MAMTLIWSAMVVASLICGVMNGSLNAVSQAAAEVNHTAGRISKGEAHPAPARRAATVVGSS